MPKMKIQAMVEKMTKSKEIVPPKEEKKPPTEEELEQLRLKKKKKEEEAEKKKERINRALQKVKRRLYEKKADSEAPSNNILNNPKFAMVARMMGARYATDKNDGNVDNHNQEENINNNPITTKNVPKKKPKKPGIPNESDSNDSDSNDNNNGQ